ncbi:unnamed protein product [Paramecium pentaurelia]|uniref:Thioredoxin domain-containing protein n=1 Tax=Paramecium pentaurelia TaxID=43138 RepID=A0A8S1VIB0_9CILI|nr:unnamed protein product [Paramecium pentaurelia]
MDQLEKKSILVSILKELPSNYEIKEIKTFTGINKQLSIQSSTTLKSLKPLQIQHRTLFDNLKKQINSQKQSFSNELDIQISKLLTTLSPKYEINDKFLGISEVERINFDTDNTQEPEQILFKLQTGFIHLIIFWASWSNKSKELIEQCENLYQKKLEWQGKIKIVGMSIDSQLQLLIKRLNNNNWKKIEHYRFPNGYDDNNQIFNELNIKDIPFIFITNKKGEITYLGSPENIFLEEFLDNELNQLFQQKCTKVNQIIIDENQSQSAIEQFRQLKHNFLKLFSIIQEANFNGKVDISLQKISTWKKNTLKRVLLESKLELIYDVHKSEENKITQFLDEFWSQIPNNLKQVLKSKIRDPDREEYEIKAKFQEIFSFQEIQLQYFPQEILKLSYMNGEYKTEKKNSFTTLPQNLTAQSFTRAISEVKDFFSNLSDDEERTINIDSITQDIKSYVTLEPFHTFQPLHNYRKWGQENYITIEHVQGQILVLDYWAYACGPCVKGISHLAQLMKNNITKWGNSVRFIILSIALSDESQLFMDLNQELQKYLEFYFPKQVRQIDQIVYGMQSIPHYLIIDKFGIIRYKGELQNIEKKVNKLRDEQNQQLQVDHQHIPMNDTKILQIITDLFYTNMKENFRLIDKEKVIQFEIVIKIIKILNKSKISKTFLQYYVRDTQLVQIKKFLDQLFNIIPKQIWTISKYIQNTISIKYPGLICTVCKKDISQHAQQYYSYFKDEHVCIECAEFDDVKKIGMERFRYADTLIFINGPLTDESVLHNIEIQKVGKNLKLKEGEIGNQKQSFICFQCRTNQPFGPRYISLNNQLGRFVEDNYIDYCQLCFTQIKNQNLKTRELTLFTRILFDYGEYSMF